MNKVEAERLIRHLCSQWAAEKGFGGAADEAPSFLEFKAWAMQRAPEAFSFRSQMGANYDAEVWFDEEFNQTWRR